MSFFAINQKGIDVYKCPSCERLILFEHGASKAYASYVKE